MHSFMHACMHAYIHTYILHSFIHSYIHSNNIHSNIHNYRLRADLPSTAAVQQHTDKTISDPYTSNPFAHTHACVHTHTLPALIGRAAGIMGKCSHVFLAILASFGFLPILAPQLGQDLHAIAHCFEHSAHVLCTIGIAVRAAVVGTRKGGDTGVFTSGQIRTRTRDRHSSPGIKGQKSGDGEGHGACWTCRTTSCPHGCPPLSNDQSNGVSNAVNLP